MKVINSRLKDCLIIKPEIYTDSRGSFCETFHELKYRKLAGIHHKFVQDNASHSSRNVLRGLHFQKTKPQGKLVRVVKGEVFDVAVDIRQNSPTYGQWDSVILSENNLTQFWIPPGFAHGFLVLSDFADFEYKCTEFYDPNDEGSLLWNDPKINISWPVKNPIISEKDLKASSFEDLYK